MIKIYFLRGNKGRLIIDARSGNERIRRATPLYYCSEKTKNEYRRILYYEYDNEKEQTLRAVERAIRNANDKVMRIVGENFASMVRQKEI